MEKIDIAKQFSKKLTRLMCENGYGSKRSKAGIDLDKLAFISGSSYQMARKYALGQVLPELPTVIKIANYLNCSPSSLLFDEEPPQSNPKKSADLIEIERSLLKYILNKSLVLVSLSKDTENIIDFIVETVYDAAHLNVDTKTIHKIIDMMISSATLLNKTDNGHKLCKS